jgi:hypothetical protein
MATTQASPDSYRVSLPPFSAENPAELNSADLPANQDHINQFATDDQVSSRESLAANVYPQGELRGANKDHQELSRVNEVERQQDQPPFPASAYHVPPKVFAPRAHAYRRDDYVERPKIPTPLPDRCQFMFSDGRQCTMARSDIHPSLCVYHSDREEQLFGDPSYRTETRKLDFPELFSAARDLSTAASVNRALAQVFRLLAQRCISRQEAATFANLGHLLLQSIRAAHAEFVDALPNGPGQDEDPGVTLSSGEGPRRERHGDQELRGAKGSHQELSPVNKVQHERAIPPEPTPERGVSSPPAHSQSTPSSQHRSEATLPSHIPATSSLPPIVPSPEPPPQRVAMSNPSKISTSAAPVYKSLGISTYEKMRSNPGLDTSDQKASIIR